MRRVLQALGVAALLVGAQGCIAWSPGQIESTSRPVPSLDDIQVIGPTEGRSCSHYVMGIAFGSEAPMANAYENAKRGSGADAIIKLTADNQHLNVLLYNRLCTTVRGDAIRYVR